MEANMITRYKNPLVLVKDVENSKKFYTEVLGLKIVSDYNTFILFQVGFAIHDATLYYNYVNRTDVKLEDITCAFYFTVDNLNELYQKLQENDIELVHEIHEEEWGEKIIRCYDPDRHVIEIGEEI